MEQSLLVFQVILMSYAINCAVYNVTPDDDRNLQHYLLNTTKYFTSNTQLLFLPGLHHLHTNLIIQNVHNISLIGSTTNGTTPDTVIQCDSSVGIVMNNITSLTMKNITIQNCMAQHGSQRAAIIITQNSFIQIHHVQICQVSKQPSLLAVNILGDSSFNNMMCNGIHLYYYDTEIVSKNHTILLKHHNSKYGIRVYMFQHTYRITLKVSDIFVQYLKLTTVLHVISNNTVNINSVFIENCQVEHNYNINEGPFYLNNVSTHFSNCKFVHNKRSTILTVKNARNMSMIHCIFQANEKYDHLIFVENTLNVLIKDSYFYNNSGQVIITVNPLKYLKAMLLADILTDVIIQNVTFSNLIAKPCILKPVLSIFEFLNARLLLMDQVIFSNINVYNAIDGIIDLTNSIVIANKYVEFLKNNAYSLIKYRCITEKCFIMIINNNTVVNITSNTLYTYFSAMLMLPKPVYPLCFFQYVTGEILDDQISSGKIVVIFDSNKFSNNLHFFHYTLHTLPQLPSVELSYTYNIHITHCYWLPHLSFIYALPVDVNKHYIQYTNNSNLHIIQEKTLCYCANESHYDCLIDELGAAYPGQTLTVPLYARLNFFFNADVFVAKGPNKTYNTSCTVFKASETIQLIGKGCTNMKYSIVFPTDKWCELYLTVSQNNSIEQNVFYIRQLTCPLGFIKSDGVCQCYPMLKAYGFTNCDINKQAILCPANQWIILIKNNSHSYYISEKCPRSYCLTFATYVNLSKPDSQCRLNRSGILCGHCKHGLSTIFGSSQCQRCTNMNLFMIIPFAIAGFALLFLLFLFGSTTNVGTFSVYILYVNILSINNTLFFPSQSNVAVKLIHILISSGNLNLAIETCFYNGMDDYAKTWLQLVFPLYVMLLTTMLMKARYQWRI